MAKIWQFASIACLIVAAILLLREYYDAAFVLAALGALAWILNYRTEIRGAQVADAKDESDEIRASNDDDEE